VRGDPRALADLSRRARIDRDRAAYPLARAARRLAPGDAEVLALTASSVAGDTQPWHRRIVEDTDRLAAFGEAIARIVRPGDRVLDLGAGTGVLSMMAVRAGAAHVYACEVNPIMADLAADIVAANGMADRITIVPRISTDIRADADLGGRVDVIVSEILADDLLGESVLPYLEDAHARLLRPGGRMTPMGGQVVVALAEWSRPPRPRVDAVAGFDLSLLSRLAPPSIKLRQGLAHELTARGPAFDLFDVDFTRGDAQIPHRTAAALVSDGAPANGVALWMRFQFDEHQSFETFPPRDGARSSWLTTFFPFNAPITPAAGDTVRVHAVRDADAICLWADDGG
jgi:type II protein arginine methyltransferase